MKLTTTGKVRSDPGDDVPPSAASQLLADVPHQFYTKADEYLKKNPAPSGKRWAWLKPPTMSTHVDRANLTLRMEGALGLIDA